MQVLEMKNKLAEKIKALEEDKRLLLEEVSQLKVVVELSEKAKSLEEEVGRLKKEAEVLKGKIPQEYLQELETCFVEEDEAEPSDDECSSCEEEFL
jgi:peptidoglycan hydrolase CwlO-like protein